jgi:glutamine synthetase
MASNVTGERTMTGNRSTGQGFIAAHDLWSDAQVEVARELRERVTKEDFRQIRLGWADQHGIVRGKTLMVDDFLASLENGRDFQSAVLVLDTTNNPMVPFFAPDAGLGIPELEGMPDAILVPDPTTFRSIPWSPQTGWILSDMYYTNGKPVELDTRRVMKRMLAQLAAQGYEYVAGLEVEFYITKIDDYKLACAESGWPPDPLGVSTIAHGYQYLTENRNDEIDPILQALQDALVGVGLPLSSMEDEWGPGQCEFTFGTAEGIAAADNMILFRTAVKQVCRRMGYHATFMCRPALPNFFSSGWHLHQSLRAHSNGANAFVSDSGEPLSPVGKAFVGGLLEHASASCLFTTPTINGYKRYKPNSLAPINASWSVESRGVLIRAIGQPGDPRTHVENRLGEPAANPYLYMSSQIAAGLDGIKHDIDPGPPLRGDPYQADKPPIPRSLMAAVDSLEASTLFRDAFGEPFIDYILRLKRAEIERFLGEVTDWEQREYFEVY